MFETKLIAAVCFFLCISILLPPLEQVYASELAEQPAPAPIDVAQALTSDETAVQFAPPVAVVETEQPEVVADVAIPENQESANIDETSQEAPPEVISEDLIDETPIDAATTSTESSDTTVATSTDAIEQTDEVTDEVAEDGVQNEEAEETTELPAETPDADSSAVTEATTTEQAPAPTPKEVHVNDSNRFQFSVDECVGVGDGAFYCSAPQSTTTNEATDAVFAATDSDGDMEIFVRVGGEEVQITNNVYDDAAPYYAVEENRVVWHSLMGDRYQIMSYDIDTNRTLQLTESPFNNMEPIMVGDQILWQAWIQDNWEIVLYDGVEIRQLTNNDVHDVSPSIKDEYVMWQTQFTDGWKVSVYNLKTEKLDVVDVEHLSGALENPRLVLLLDHVDEQGVRQMVGYDLETKKPVDLTAIPAPLPDELPEPDQTGEERAFVQNKPGLKETDDVNDADDDLGTQTNNPMPDLSTAAGTTPTAIASSTDLVIPPYIATSSAPILTDTETPVPVILPADVVIPPFSTSTEASVE